MGTVTLGNTGDEPEAPAQHTQIEEKRKREAAWALLLIPTPGKITHSSLLSPHYIPLDVVPTFFQNCSLDAAAYQCVVCHLMSDQIKDEGNPSRVLEGDFTDQCSLEASSIWERSILVQKVTVLLSWKSLTNNFCFTPASAGYNAITRRLKRKEQAPDLKDGKPPSWLKMTMKTSSFH